MDDLLPCPFCAGFAEHGEIADDCMPPHPDQSGHFIQCTNNMCGASTNLRFACGDDPKPLLTEQWNNRRSLTELLSLIFDLSDCLTDEGPDYSVEGLDRMRRRVATALADRCPEWLDHYRAA
jgi:hypothetical protein